MAGRQSVGRSDAGVQQEMPSFLAPGLDQVRERRSEILAEIKCLDRPGGSQAEVKRQQELESSYAVLEFYDERSPPFRSSGDDGCYEVVTINGFHFEAKVVTGSNVNVLPRRLFLAAGLDPRSLTRSDETVRAITGGPVKEMVGAVEAESSILGKTKRLRWEVMETELFAMLGFGACRTFGINISMRDGRFPAHVTRGAPPPPPSDDEVKTILIPTLRAM